MSTSNNEYFSVPHQQNEEKNHTQGLVMDLNKRFRLSLMFDTCYRSEIMAKRDDSE